MNPNQMLIVSGVRGPERSRTPCNLPHSRASDRTREFFSEFVPTCPDFLVGVRGLSIPALKRTVFTRSGTTEALAESSQIKPKIFLAGSLDHKPTGYFHD